MTTPMTEKEYEVFKLTLEQIALRGTEKEVRKYVDDNFERLPKEVQEEIMTEMTIAALQEELADKS